MFRKIDLHEIPTFFIETEHDSEIVKNAVIAFETERSKYGYKRLTIIQKKQTRERFCKESGYPLAFDSVISLEIWKQGRSRRWLHERLIHSGHENLTYLSLCQRISSYGKLTKELKKDIYKLLAIH